MQIIAMGGGGQEEGLEKGGEKKKTEKLKWWQATSQPTQYAGGEAGKKDKLAPHGGEPKRGAGDSEKRGFDF